MELVGGRTVAAALACLHCLLLSWDDDKVGVVVPSAQCGGHSRVLQCPANSGCVLFFAVERMLLLCSGFFMLPLVSSLCIGATTSRNKSIAYC